MRWAKFVKQEWAFLRDVILFFGGLTGVFYMLIFDASDPTFLLLFGAMMGLPAFLRNDESKREK